MANPTVTLPGFKEAKRLQQSALAGAERRALVWMAERTPRWISSDDLSALGAFAMAEGGLAYWAAAWDRRWLFAVVAALALNWVGDSLDGTLARVRRQQRPRYGFYVDHMVDMLGATALMCGLGFSGFLHWQTAAAMLVAFLLLSGESYLATYTLQCFELSHGLFGPTEIRILLIIGNLALLRTPYANVFGEQMLLFD